MVDVNSAKYMQRTIIQNGYSSLRDSHICFIAHQIDKEHLNWFISVIVCDTDIKTLSSVTHSKCQRLGEWSVVHNFCGQIDRYLCSFSSDTMHILKSMEFMWE